MENVGQMGFEVLGIVVRRSSFLQCFKGVGVNLVQLFIFGMIFGNLFNFLSFRFFMCKRKINFDGMVRIK